MGSPLSKRFKRELAANAGKYLGIFAMMVVAIGFTSGFLSAASSIEVLIKGMDDRYSIEDARIEVAEELSEADISAAQDACNDEDAGEVTFTRLFSIDVGFTSENAQKDTSARVYERRIDVDIAAYSEGVAPQDSGEIALDRVFCANNEISVGDEVVVGGRSLTVSGIMTLPDYSALFEDNSDFIFNALTFTVAEVSEEGFDALEESGAAVTYSYALTFANANATAADRSSAESEIAVALDGEGVQVEDLTDKSENKGIGYPEEDVRGDQSMWEVLMALLIVIMSFMFVVLTVSTIDAESAVIGTLLANGWSKRELVIHYATLPCLIGVIAAGMGNVLGYVVLADTMQGLYYNSYSLPPYEPVLSWRVICITTVAPLLLLFVITIVGLVKRMRSTPLQFLRHEKGEGKAGRAPGGVPGEPFSWLRSRGSCRENGSRGSRSRGSARSRRFRLRDIELPEALSFPVRFRLRVLLTNLGNFTTLFFGIMFASILLLFGLCVMPTMDKYASELRDDVVAEHMYILKYPLELERGTEDADAIDAYETLSGIETYDDMQALGLTLDDVDELSEKAKTLENGVYPVNAESNSQEAISQAEKYAVSSLDYELAKNGGSGVMTGWGGQKESFSEEITVYGVTRDSRYFTGLTLGNAQAVASKGFMDKYDISPGDTIVLSDKYGGSDYRIVVNGSYGSESSLNLYMSLERFNECFGNDRNWFNGWASDIELNIEGTYLASELTPSDMDKIGAQMTNSMGDMMDMIMVIAILIFVVFMYLLTKTVIDRSARSISYLKVFGYRNREINRLYIRSLTWTVTLSLVLCQPIIIAALSALFETMMKSYSGNIVVYVPPLAICECVAAGLLSYAAIALLHTRRIRKVPLEIALKVQE